MFYIHKPLAFLLLQFNFQRLGEPNQLLGNDYAH